MKKLLLLLFLINSAISMAQLSWNGGTTPEETESAILLFDKTGTGLASYTGTIYAHTGVTIDDTTSWQNVIGDWGNNTTQPSLTLVSGNTYQLDLSPTIKEFYNYNGTGNITKINIVLRSENGSQQTSDLEINVGAFQVTTINPSPSSNGAILVENGSSTQIIAQNTGGPANYELFANGESIHTQTNTTFYNGYSFSNLTENQYCELVVTQGSSTVTKPFVILVNNTVNATLPANLSNGINYNEGDPSKATLVLEAPNKDFVYIAGSFNDWTPTSIHAMKKDESSSQFWLELTGLTPGENYTYQYWVGDKTNLPANSQGLVKVADPYSSLILDPNNDQYISTENYPNMPTYPSGQSGIVTVLNTQESNYIWQETDFTRPEQENLVIYELLMRDFTDSSSYLDAITHLDYLESLGINAIELMPVNEFEGNSSWGYNPSFYMALDKAYGTKNHFKEFIDECHERGIAIILDVVFNHSYGQSPLVQMYWDTSNNIPASDNPYFNQNHNLVDNTSAHWGYDFNHESTYTVNFFNDVLSFWMDEYKVDGFRFDFTKGFSNTLYYGANNWASAYDASRIENLKAFADHVWNTDPTNQPYVIFEHLSDNSEETVLANYGIMLWGNMNHNFNQNTMGYSDSADLSWASYINRGWENPNLVTYMESHDEERLMYKNLAYGNSNGSYNVQDLDTALERQEAASIIFYSIPGPKMLWQFGELGYDYSINYCPNDDSINENCRLDPKPDAWSLNYDTDTSRQNVFNTTSAMINLKKQYPSTFNTANFTLDVNGLVKRINLYDDEGNLDMVVMANFDVTTQSINPNFPTTGEWFEYFTEASLNVTNTTTPISLEPGEYRLYSQTQNLSTEEFELTAIKLMPNPTNNSFQINKATTQVAIYDITGKLVKSFSGDFQEGHGFDISNLMPSIYMVKLKNEEGQTATSKLIKL